MFEHYYPSESTQSLTQEEFDVYQHERDIHFAVTDFADMVDKVGFLPLMALLTEELQRRGYTSRV